MTKNNRHCVNTMCKSSLKLVKSIPVLTPPCTPVDHLRVLIGQMDLHITSPRLAGRLSHYVHNWEHITQDRWVLQSITGYQLELTQTPHQANQPQEILCSKVEHSKISQEISELLVKGAIVEAQLTTGSFISQIFLVEKKGGDRGHS